MGAGVWPCTVLLVPARHRHHLPRGRARGRHQRIEPLLLQHALEPLVAAAAQVARQHLRGDQGEIEETDTEIGDVEELGRRSNLLVVRGRLGVRMQLLRLLEMLLWW